MGKFLNELLKMGIAAQQQKKKQQAAAEREAREKQELANKIRAQAKEQADQWLKIINDCANLVNTTVNPEVFFPRYSLMLDYLEKLAGLECTGIFNNSKAKPKEEFYRVDDLFPAATNSFIDRSFAAAKEKAEALKTESGKKNAISRFFASMDKYRVEMEPESIRHLDELRKAATED